MEEKKEATMIKRDVVNELRRIGVQEKTAIELKDTFTPFFDQADEWIKKATALVVINADQIEEIASAREIRLRLRNIRIEVEKKRKSLKEESLRKGKAIDGMANIIKFLIIPVEEHLQEQEDFVKRQEEQHKTELTEKRANELAEYEVETEYYNLAEMSEEGYKQLLQTSKLVYEQKQEAERRAEKKRIANEQAEAKRRKRIEEENKKLKAEAKERERQAKIERDKQTKIEAERRAKEKKEREAYEIKLKKEREEKELIEAELRAKKETEEKARLEAKIQEREARLAPDKKKLERLAITIMELEMPEVISKEAKNIVENTVELLNKTSNYIKQRCIDL